MLICCLQLEVWMKSYVMLANKADPYYLLTRREQVTVFRLRTGQNRLNYHLYSKLRIGHTEQCPCDTGSQTTEYLLQSCPIYEPLRKGVWPDHTSSMEAWGTCDALPPSSRRLEFPSDEREEEEEVCYACVTGDCCWICYLAYAMLMRLRLAALFKKTYCLQLFWGIRFVQENLLPAVVLRHPY